MTWTIVNLKSRPTGTYPWSIYSSKIFNAARNFETRIWRSVEYWANEPWFITFIKFPSRKILDSYNNISLDDIFMSMFGRRQKRNIPINFFTEEQFEPFLYYWGDLYFQIEQWCNDNNFSFCILYSNCKSSE